MMLLLPETLDEVLPPIFEALPMERAMSRLVVKSSGSHPTAAERVAEAVKNPAVRDRLDLIAGLWLYVDELDLAHRACQDLDTPTGAYWHAVVHRREADFDNARYWFRRAPKHPAMDLIDLTGGGAGSGTAVAAYDPVQTVDQVERAHERGDLSNPALISAQNKEWKALFSWCVQQ